MLLPFPDTALGTSSSLTLSVGNVGFGTLTVTDIAVDPGFEASFAIVPSSTTVLVNQIVDLTVTFTPQSLGLTAAQLYVRSDDPDEPEVAVLMNGKGL